MTTRQKILFAAAHVFSQKDFYQTKLEEVAEAAGLGKGTIYLYFKDKTELFISAVEFMHQMAIEQTEIKLTGITSPMMRLRLSIQLWLAAFVEHRQGILSFRSYTAAIPEEHRERVLAIRNSGRAYLQKLIDSIAQKSGHKGLKRPSELLAEVLLDAVFGYIARPDFEEFVKEYPPEKYAVFLVDVILPQHEWMKEKPL
ncbi:MAG: TetR/AcrR family transcriptional regulator [bacterium]